MGSNSTEGVHSANPKLASGRNEMLHNLVPVACGAANAQLDAFIARLSDALLKLSEFSGDAKIANLSFNAGNLLKKNSYAFYYLASESLEKALRHQTLALEQPSLSERRLSDDILSLVPYSEIEDRVLLGNVSRLIENANSDRLTALGIRIAEMLQRDEISIAQNPFRPEVFLSAINDAWCGFDPDTESHHLVLPLLQPEVFLDLSALLQTLNQTLIGWGVLPDLVESYRIRKSRGNPDAGKGATAESTIYQQLQQLFAAEPAGSAIPDGALGANLQSQVLQATAASNQLLGYLAGMQKSMSSQHFSAGFASAPQNTALLSNIKTQAPQGVLTRVDKNTIDLLTQVFDVVFGDQNIPPEIKGMIGFLQVPVLKAALIDKDFFFKEEHPARRLIELLSQSGLAWDQKKGQDDPLYQLIKRNVHRVEQEFDQQITVFSDVVSDLESFIKDEENASISALSAPIEQAVHQEKLVKAKKTATTEVALRVGTGEVVAFVETFLESKWVPVLTIAYSIQDEKPEALASATKTMDELVWSVKPKITQEQRKELIAMLPSMLANLNKWLNVVKWEDADRLQFFADLAECHASIVRAPIEISPQRQLEIAMEAAKKAAERRLEKRANEQPEAVPVADDAVERVAKLKRGTWMEFTKKDDVPKKVKLAWVSPMQSLYIFTTKEKSEAFSISAEDLAQAFREERASVVLEGLVERALAQALENVSANDSMIAIEKKAMGM